MLSIDVDTDISLKMLDETHAGDLKRILVLNESRFAQFIQVETTELSHLRNFISNCHKSTQRQTGIYLGIFFRGALGGQIRFEIDPPFESDPRRNGYINIAYWVASEFSGRAVAYRALRASLPVVAVFFWGSRTPTRFEALIHKDNLASQAVVSRLGFRKESSRTQS